MVVALAKLKRLGKSKVNQVEKKKVNRWDLIDFEAVDIVYTFAFRKGKETCQRHTSILILELAYF